MSTNAINTIEDHKLYLFTGAKKEIEPPKEFILAEVEETVDFPTTNGFESEEAARRLIAVIEKDFVTFKMETGGFAYSEDEDGCICKDFVSEDTSYLYEVHKSDFDIEELQNLLNAIKGA